MLSKPQAQGLLLVACSIQRGFLVWLQQGRLHAPGLRVLPCKILAATLRCTLQLSYFKKVCGSDTVVGMSRDLRLVCSPVLHFQLAICLASACCRLRPACLPGNLGGNRVHT